MKKESASDLRKSVLWVGAAPTEITIAEFKNRGLIVQTCDEGAVVKGLPLSRAIIFHFDPKHENAFSSALSTFGTRAVDHGLLVVALADTDQAFLAMDNVLRSLKLNFRVAKGFAHRSHEMGELVRRYDPGPGEGQVEVLGESVSERTRLFLCRAFNDCTSITIKNMNEGRSAKVFSVYALFKDSRVGPRPLPFFAKVDWSGKILNEWSKYQNPVGHFIPFQARPDLEPDRCFTGSSHGILVGNFVENSESLWDVARRGAAQPVIYSLFDEALRGWRLQAYAHEEAAAFGKSLWDSLMAMWDLVRCLPQLARRAESCAGFGKVRGPKEILDVLKSRGNVRHRLAPCHGDLHVHNVRARRGEAILIDFNSAQFSGPLVADPASLEVSLVFETDSSDKDNEGWRALADSLYKSDYFHRAPPPPKEPAAREWMWACVRQVRLLALESQETDREYHYAVIWYLLRRAAFNNESGRDKFRRDFAYYLASRLTDDLEKILAT